MHMRVFRVIPAAVGAVVVLTAAGIGMAAGVTTNPSGAGTSGTSRSSGTRHPGLLHVQPFQPNFRAADKATASHALTAGVSHVPAHSSSRVTGKLRPSPFQPRFAVPGVTAPTVPYYAASFSHGGKTYPYTSIGTDPRTSTATTHVPVTFVPVRINMSDGAYSYPTGAIGQTTGSLLFNNRAIPINGPSVTRQIAGSEEYAQYGDATLRSSYWKYVSANGAKWNVLLDQPTTTSLRTISVPSGQGSWYGPDSNGYYVMVVNNTWYEKKLNSVVASMSAKSLVVFLTYDVVGCSDYTNLSTCGTGGFHSMMVNTSGTHTYAWGSWLDSSVAGTGFADTAPMSHEVAEWLNDPFLNDVVPSWNIPSEPQYGCSKLFEVGDPLVNTIFTIDGLDYQDEADFSWFARQNPSIGYHGSYSDLGTLTTYSPSC